MVVILCKTRKKVKSELVSFRFANELVRVCYTWDLACGPGVKRFSFIMSAPHGRADVGKSNVLSRPVDTVGWRVIFSLKIPRRDDSEVFIAHSSRIKTT